MSHLIVFDMEWNMGYQPRTFEYHGVEQLVRGEIIQIGAVKMEGQEIRDTFRVNLRPRMFKKLHHHVAKVTGLTQKDLNEGMPIAEGLRKFREWCGEDAALGEWGLDDIPVLKQNLYLTGQDENWPTQWYDLQKVYTAQRPLKEGEGLSLESVVERLGIEKGEDFHDALADAMYTAKVIQKVDIAKGLAAYPNEEEQLREVLCPADKHRRDFTSWKGFPDGETWRTDARMHAAVCPDCGKPLIPDSDGMWLTRGNNCLYSMERCDRHGPTLVWLRRSRTDGLHYLFGRATEKADQESQRKWAHDKKAALGRARSKRANEEKLPHGTGRDRRAPRTTRRG